jgi:tRNA G37 N-methylase TrmD
MIVGMQFDIVTIFPGFFESVFAHGIVSRALKNGLVTIEAYDLREYAHNRSRWRRRSRRWASKAETQQPRSQFRTRG